MQKICRLFLVQCNAKRHTCKLSQQKHTLIRHPWVTAHRSRPVVHWMSLTQLCNFKSAQCSPSAEQFLRYTCIVKEKECPCKLVTRLEAGNCISEPGPNEDAANLEYWQMQMKKSMISTLKLSIPTTCTCTVLTKSNPCYEGRSGATRVMRASSAFYIAFATRMSRIWSAPHLYNIRVTSARDSHNIRTTFA
jgi:hypothetical protein